MIIQGLAGYFGSFGILYKR